MAAVTETIVSGPLCADAADCRLLGSALFGEKLTTGDAAGLRIGVVRDAVSEDVAPEVRDACEAAIEALLSETGGEVREVELDGLETATMAAVLIINAELMNGVTPQRLNELDPGLSPINRGFVKYRMLMPAAAIVQAKRIRTLMRHRLAALFEQVDVVAWPTLPAVAPPLESPLVELPSGTLTADQANVRGGALANLTGSPRSASRSGSAPAGCRSASSSRPPGGGTSCCSTRRRRWSGPTAGAGSRRSRPLAQEGEPTGSRPMPAIVVEGLEREFKSDASRWRASTSRSPPARSTASSARTGPASRPPSRMLTTLLPPTAGAPRSPGSTSSPRPARCAGRSASPCRRRRSTR